VEDPSNRGFGGGGDRDEATSVEIVWLLGASVTATSSSDVTEFRRVENTEAAVKSTELSRDRGAGDLRTAAPVKSTTSTPIASSSPASAFEPEPEMNVVNIRNMTSSRASTRCICCVTVCSSWRRSLSASVSGCRVVVSGLAGFSSASVTWTVTPSAEDRCTHDASFGSPEVAAPALTVLESLACVGLERDSDPVDFKRAHRDGFAAVPPAPPPSTAGFASAAVSADFASVGVEG